MLISAGRIGKVGAASVFKAAANTIDYAPLIIFSDVATDIDDISALVVGLGNQSATNTRLKHVVIDSRNVRGAPMVEAVLRVYGNDATVGAYKGSLGNYPSYPYTSDLLDTFGSTELKAKTIADYPDEVSSTRAVLAGFPDQSVIFANIGGMVGLSNLLDSPADGISPLTGMQLFAAKVKLTSIMAGNFGSTTTPETNVNIHLASSQNVAAKLASQNVIWSGAEIGSSVRMRPSYFQNPFVDPHMRGYDTFGSAQSNNLHFITGGRASYDPIAVDIAQRGLGERYIFNATGVGTVTFNASGHTLFTPGSGNNRYILRANTGTGQPGVTRTVAKELEDIAQSVSAPIDPNRKGMYLPLNEVALDKFYRDPDAPGFHLLAGAQPRAASTIYPGLINASTVGGSTGTVLDFDGTSDYIGYYGTPYWHVPTYVCGGVFRLTDVTTSRGLFGVVGPAPALFEANVSGGQVTATSWAAATRGTPRITPGAEVSANTWVMVTIRKDADNLYLYLNGILAQTVAAVGQYTNPDIDYTQNQTGWFNVGCSRATSGAVERFMQGQLASFGFWGDGTVSSLDALHVKLRAYASAKGITV